MKCNEACLFRHQITPCTGTQRLRLQCEPASGRVHNFAAYVACNLDHANSNVRYGSVGAISRAHKPEWIQDMIISRLSVPFWTNPTELRPSRPRHKAGS